MHACLLSTKEHSVPYVVLFSSCLFCTSCSWSNLLKTKAYCYQYQTSHSSSQKLEKACSKLPLPVTSQWQTGVTRNVTGAPMHARVPILTAQSVPVLMHVGIMFDRQRTRRDGISYRTWDVCVRRASASSTCAGEWRTRKRLVPARATEGEISSVQDIHIDVHAF